MNLENVDKLKVTTQKSLVLKSCRILDFHSEYYISKIKILDFYLPHVYILGKNNCLGKQHGVFVSRHNKFDSKCKCDHAERCQLLS